MYMLTSFLHQHHNFFSLSIFVVGSEENVTLKKRGTENETKIFIPWVMELRETHKNREGEARGTTGVRDQVLKSVILKSVIKF